MEEMKKTTKEVRRRTTKKNDGKMKKTSRRAMIFATIWIVVATVLKDVFNFNIPMQDILTVAVSVVGIWTPGYISIWIDKLTSAHLGK